MTDYNHKLEALKTYIAESINRREEERIYYEGFWSMFNNHGILLQPRAVRFFPDFETWYNDPLR